MALAKGYYKHHVSFNLNSPNQSASKVLILFCKKSNFVGFLSAIRRSKVKKICISGEKNVQRTLPINFSDEHIKYFARNLKAKIPKTYLYKFKNITMLGDGLLLKNAVIISQSLHWLCKQDALALTNSS